MAMPLASVACTDGASVGVAVNADVGSELGGSVSGHIDGDRVASPTGCMVGESVEALLESVGVREVSAGVIAGEGAALGFKLKAVLDAPDGPALASAVGLVEEVIQGAVLGL